MFSPSINLAFFIKDLFMDTQTLLVVCLMLVAFFAGFLSGNR